MASYRGLVVVGSPKDTVAQIRVRYTVLGLFRYCMDAPQPLAARYVHAAAPDRLRTRNRRSRVPGVSSSGTGKR